MSHVDSLTVTVTFPWWSRPYIKALACVARLTGTAPDPDKAAALILRHTKFDTGRGHIPPRPVPNHPNQGPAQPTRSQSID